MSSHGEVSGKGSFGVVRKVQCRQTKAMRVMKIVDKQKRGAKTNISGLCQFMTVYIAKSYLQEGKMGIEKIVVGNPP